MLVDVACQWGRDNVNAKTSFKSEWHMYNCCIEGLLTGANPSNRIILSSDIPPPKHFSPRKNSTQDVRPSSRKALLLAKDGDSLMYLLAPAI